MYFSFPNLRPINTRTGNYSAKYLFDGYDFTGYRVLSGMCENQLSRKW